MQTVAFTLAGAALYLLSDWLLDRIEQRRGRRFKYRSLVFFGLILLLALSSFAVLERLLG